MSTRRGRRRGRRSRTTYPRRRYTRRPYKKNRNTKLLVNRGPAVMPDIYMTRCKYSELFSSSAVASNDTVFRINSAYDPNYSGTGHQPIGYDELTAFYANYLVTGCKLKVTVMSVSLAATAADVQFTVLPNNDPTVFTSYQLIAEQPYALTRYMGSAYSQGIRTIKYYVRPHKILGVSVQKYNTDDQYSALVSANPAVECYWHIFQSDLSADNLNITFKVDCTYYVKFFGRKALSSS